MALARTFKRKEFQAKGGRGRRRGKRKEKVKKGMKVFLVFRGVRSQPEDPPPTHCDGWVGRGGGCMSLWVHRCVLLCGDQRTS